MLLNNQSNTHVTQIKPSGRLCFVIVAFPGISTYFVMKTRYMIGKYLVALYLCTCIFQLFYLNPVVQKIVSRVSNSILSRLYTLYIIRT